MKSWWCAFHLLFSGMCVGTISDILRIMEKVSIVEMLKSPTTIIWQHGRADIKWSTVLKVTSWSKSIKTSTEYLWNG